MESFYFNYQPSTRGCHVYGTWGPFHERSFHRILNSMENWFKCCIMVMYHNTTKSCTCHESTAVVPCAKFHSNHFRITSMRLEWNFHRIWITMEKSFVKWASGARFTNDILPAIQTRWKLRLAVIPLLAIRSQQIFAHATTAQLSCHVQNFVAITVLASRWEWNEISIEFELRWKSR